VLAATEAHAESVEAVVLRETDQGPAIATGDGAGSIARSSRTSEPTIGFAEAFRRGSAASTARVPPADYTCLHQLASRSS
jgi:hypothetical protein